MFDCVTMGPHWTTQSNSAFSLDCMHHTIINILSITLVQYEHRWLANTECTIKQVERKCNTTKILMLHQGIAIYILMQPDSKMRVNFWRCGRPVAWPCHLLTAKPDNTTAAHQWLGPHRTSESAFVAKKFLRLRLKLSRNFPYVIQPITDTKQFIYLSHPCINLCITPVTNWISTQYTGFCR